MSYYLLDLSGRELELLSQRVQDKVPRELDNIVPAMLQSRVAISSQQFSVGDGAVVVEYLFSRFNLAQSSG